MGSKLSRAISAFRTEVDELYEEGPLDSSKSMVLCAEIQKLKSEHDQAQILLEREQMELLELRAHLNERRHVLEAILSDRLQQVVWRVRENDFYTLNTWIKSYLFPLIGLLILV